ncbi:MAG: argininosuccinate synthase [Thermoprotei archaeon]|jgi:argininosuccinate synthase
MKKIVLAYSGGLDTSVSIKWLQEKYGYEVITVTLDVGQGEDFGEIEKKAYEIGAVKHYTINVLDEFVRDYINPAIKANALYQNKYPLSSALSRPLISKYLVKIAEKENAEAVAHGSTGKGNDQVRFEVTIKALNPNLKIIAPVREWNLTREEEIEYAKKHGIPIRATKKSPYSIDQNLWGRSIEGGVLEYPEEEPPSDVFEWTVDPVKAPDTPGYITIGFRDGIPISLNGEEIDEIALISELNRIVGMHGIGRIDHMEDRLVGIKSREVYECPAALAIIEAHKDLEKFVLTRHENNLKEMIDQTWTQLVYSGLWMEPLRLDLQAFIDSTQIPRVSGQVTLKLFKGGMRVVGRKSDYALYDLKLSTYDASSTFNQKDAIGFIELWGLQTVTAHKVLRMVNENARKTMGVEIK